QYVPAFPPATFLPVWGSWALRVFLLVIKQRPSSGKAPFGVQTIPSMVIALGTFRLTTVPDRSSLNQRLENLQLGQHCRVRTLTPGAIAHLFIASSDARLLGIA